MNKIVCAFVALFLSFLLAACGGGSDVLVADQAASAANPSFTAQAVPDVKVVSTVIEPEVTVSPGQQGVELYSFRLACPTSACKPIRALKFTGSVSQDMLKSVSLEDATGRDISADAIYNWSVEKSGTLIVQFQLNSWLVYHEATGTVPVYFLKADIATNSQKGDVIQLALTDIDTDGFGMTVTPGAAGPKVTVIPAADQHLPVVTASTFNTLNNVVVGKDTLLGAYQVTCPIENTWGCLHTGEDMGVYAADSLSVQNQNGMIAQQSTTVGGMTKIRFYDYIAPGATQVYSIYGQPNQTTVVLYMAKLSFSVNVNQTWVSPIVPANPEDCQYLVRNERYCKG